MDNILNYDILKEFKKLLTFEKILIKSRKCIFDFLYHLGVLPDNKAIERAIKFIKVKQKFSGQFRSEKDAIIP